MFRDTPCLARHRSKFATDEKSTYLELANGFCLWLAWSGSATALASHPVRLIFNDEVDKFAILSGKEADPISLAEQRIKTWGDTGIIVNVSSPTTDEGLISVLVRDADIVLRYFVPCPYCGKRFELCWESVVWDKTIGGKTVEEVELASHIEQSKGAWYRCLHCNERIPERLKPGMVRSGLWATEQQIADGCDRDVLTRPGSVLRAGLPRARHVAFLLESLSCMWVNASDLVAKFLRVRHDPVRLMGFLNSDLGRPFASRTEAVGRDVFSAKCVDAAPAGVVPTWACRLLATADVQLDHLWVVIRAWGPRLRSRRVWHGRIAAPTEDPRGWEELLNRCFATRYPVEGHDEISVSCDALGVDLGYRRDEVLRLVAQDPRVQALRGNGKPQSRLVELRRDSYVPPGSSTTDTMTVWYHLVDTDRCKDWLASAIRSRMRVRLPEGEQEFQEVDQWELNADNDPEYNRQMSSEHKVLVRKGAAQPIERWVARSGAAGKRNHFWDCEYNQRALAFITRADLVEDTEAVALRAARKPVQDSRPLFGPLTLPSGRAWGSR
jgi:phage terminase large subunit GpA-like protein